MADLQGLHIPNEIILKILWLVQRAFQEDGRTAVPMWKKMCKFRLVSRSTKLLAEPIMLADVDMTDSLYDRLRYHAIREQLKQTPPGARLSGFSKQLDSLTPSEGFPTVQDLERHTVVLGITGSFCKDSLLWTSLHSEKLKALRIDGLAGAEETTADMWAIGLGQIMHGHEFEVLKIDVSQCSDALAIALQWKGLPTHSITSLHITGSTRATANTMHDVPYATLAALFFTHSDIASFRSSYTCDNVDTAYFDKSSYVGLKRLPAFQRLGIGPYAWARHTVIEMQHFWDWSQLTHLILWSSMLEDFLFSFSQIGFHHLQNLQSLAVGGKIFGGEYNHKLINEHLDLLFRSTSQIRAISLQALEANRVVDSLVKHGHSGHVFELDFGRHIDENDQNKACICANGFSDLDPVSLQKIAISFPRLSDLTFVLNPPSSVEHLQPFIKGLQGCRNLRRLRLLGSLDHDSWIDGQLNQRWTTIIAHQTIFNALRAGKQGIEMESMESCP